MAQKVDPRRIRDLKAVSLSQGSVVYWMSRDQRVKDNWALVHAQQEALSRKSPLAVVFCLVPEFLGATLRHYDFMLAGLEQLEKRLRSKNIPFTVLFGEASDVLPPFVKKHNVSLIVADFSPLRIYRKWKKQLADSTSIAIHEVDAHNIVPCWTASNKQDYAARTFRPKVKRLLPEFLKEIPRIKKHPHPWPVDIREVDWQEARKTITVDSSVKPVEWIAPGESAALKALNRFLGKKLAIYADERNDPSKDTLSNLSPYLHFGQISAQRVALEAESHDQHIRSQESFLEELIVRRELSDNFCFYNDKYDSVDCFHDWAKKTLDEHRDDPRPVIYSMEQLETADTHDDLWNASQLEMVHIGKMHGYMRMYWAKKIFEWSRSPEDAMQAAIYLNDKYELDGRDPNGYTGIAWSIGGIHDRAWFERQIFGKIRYMSYDGCKRKFDTGAYIGRVVGLAKKCK